MLCAQDIAGPNALNLNATLTGAYRDVSGIPLFGKTNFDDTCSTSGTFAAAVRHYLLAAANLPQGVLLLLTVYFCTFFILSVFRG